MDISEIIKYLSDSKEIIGAGLFAITFVVYAENGLFFAFFLPGDYLLFLTGVFVGTGFLKYAIGTVLLYLFVAAVLGSLTGFLFGRFFGSNLENKPDTWYFKQKHLDSTRDFFEKYGSQALIICRFLPYIRTFAPILAGISRMNYPKYLFYNVVGGAVWVGSLVGGGYYFGVEFPWIINYVHYVIFFFLAITTFTVVKGYLNFRNK
ncbi:MULTISPECIES: DedA family protein [Arcicella]|uniref:DedA family protein n=2 Tax=Arcicella TaxID=217140 RepID=A0ABU5SJ88_9BACT|nr:MULTISPECIES: DedA family protein [unclassified Arcicella]MEA5404001.1 DedA family protein [Arcicella sp. DC2W]MEA5427305.1 DedA family protein [Arcicella sp. DC25W]